MRVPRKVNKGGTKCRKKSFVAGFYEAVGARAYWVSECFKVFPVDPLRKHKGISANKARGLRCAGPSLARRFNAVTLGRPGADIVIRRAFSLSHLAGK